MGSGTTRAGTLSRRQLVWLHRTLGCLFVVSVAVLGLRLASSARHPRPGLPVSPRLELLPSPFFSPQRYRLPEKASIVAVNGTPVATLDEYLEASVGRCNRLTLAAESGEPRALDLIWLEVPSFHHLAIGPDWRFPRNEPGDETLECLDGSDRWKIVDVNGQAPPANGIEEIFSRARSRVSLGLERGTQEARVLVRLIDWRAHWAIFVVGALSGVLGLWVAGVKPDTRSSWGFLAFCLLIGLFGCARAIPHQYRGDVVRVAFVVLQCFIPGAAALFVFTFTALRTTLRRLSPLVWTGGLFATGLLAANPVLGWEEMRHGVLATPLFFLWRLSLLLLLLAALGGDLVTRALGAPLSATDRLRSRVFRWATLVGFGPLALFTATLGFSRRPEVRVWFELTPVLFVALIAYAIVRHNLLQLNELVRESVVFAVASGGLIAIYVALGSAAGSVADRWFPGSQGWLPGAGTAIFVLLAAPLLQRVRKGLAARLLYRADSYDDLVSTLQAQSGPRLSLHAHCDLLAKGAANLVGTESAMVLLRRPAGDDWWLAAATSLPPSGPRLAPCLPLLRRAAERPVGEIHRDDVIDSLGQPAARRHLLEGLDELQANLVVALRAHERVLGVVAVGQRRDGRNYLGRDLDRLRGLVEEAQRSLDRALYELIYRQKRRIIALYPDAPLAIGPYAVDRTLGQGGMSFVYLGRRGERLAALKVPNHRVQGDERLMERFFRESQSMTKLSHPNILKVYDVGWEELEPYIAVEYCRRGSLRACLERQGPLAEDQVRELIRQAALALEKANDRGVTHRDVTLGNVFLGDDGLFKLGDFGLAHVVDDTTVTSTGALLGTPAYFAPEIAAGSRGTWSADQYSLGICAFELLAGERPFRPVNAAQAIALHLYEPLPSLHGLRPDVSSDLAEIIATMTAKRPEDRFDSWRSLLGRLTP